MIVKAAFERLQIPPRSQLQSRLPILALSVFLAGCASLPLDSAHEPLPAATFAEPDVEIPTPAFQADDGYTNQQALLSFAAELAQQPHVFLREAGVSQLGQSIPMLVFTRASDASPDALALTGKPTVWLMAAQHGNEPASGEGALAMAAELAGPLMDIIDDVNVIIVPRANPDGAQHGRRSAHDGRDLNRDSIRQLLAESRQLRRLISPMTPY